MFDAPSLQYVSYKNGKISLNVTNSMRDTKWWQHIRDGVLCRQAITLSVTDKKPNRGLIFISTLTWFRRPLFYFLHLPTPETVTPYICASCQCTFLTRSICVAKEIIKMGETMYKIACWWNIFWQDSNLAVHQVPSYP